MKGSFVCLFPRMVMALAQGIEGDFFPFAPTTIAARDEGLGRIGSMPEGLGAAVGIISGPYATTRLHAEDAYLASSNYLQYGAGKVTDAWMGVSHTLFN